MKLREVRDYCNSMAARYLNDYPWGTKDPQIESAYLLMEEWVQNDLGIRITPQVEDVISEAIHLERYGMTVDQAVDLALKAAKARRLGL